MIVEEVIEEIKEVNNFYVVFKVVVDLKLNDIEKIVRELNVHNVLD